MKTEILYEDEDILAVYKPAGVAVQSMKVGQIDVVSELKNYLRQPGERFRAMSGQAAPYLGIVHRLDQPVEGLLVFAKNKKAAAALSAQLQRQGDRETFHKQYYAVIWGYPGEKEGELVDFLYKNKENKAIIVNKQEVPEAKQAVLQYHILQVREIETFQESLKCQEDTQFEKRTKPSTGRLALVDIHIGTGRFHQIRAQMAHAGMPLLGDLKYGSEQTQALSRRLGVKYVALSAYNLEFLHPVSNRKMSFQVRPKGKIFSFFEE